MVPYQVFFLSWVFVINLVILHSHVGEKKLFQNFAEPEDLSAYDGLELRLKGDGRRYKFVVRTSSDWDTVGYTASFDTVGGQWQSVSTLLTVFIPVVDYLVLKSYYLVLKSVVYLFQIRLPFSSLRPIFRARTVLDAPPFDPSNIVSLQVCLCIYYFFSVSDYASPYMLQN